MIRWRRGDPPPARRRLRKRNTPGMRASCGLCASRRARRGRVAFRNRFPRRPRIRFYASVDVTKTVFAQGVSQCVAWVFDARLAFAQVEHGRDGGGERRLAVPTPEAGRQRGERQSGTEAGGELRAFRVRDGLRWAPGRWRGLRKPAFDKVVATLRLATAWQVGCGSRVMRSARPLRIVGRLNCGLFPCVMPYTERREKRT